MKLVIKEATAYDNMLQGIRDFLEDTLDAKFEFNLAQQTASKVKGYKTEWCVETESEDLKKARENYVDAIMADLIGQMFEK